MFCGNIKGFTVFQNNRFIISQPTVLLENIAISFAGQKASLSLMLKTNATGIPCHTISNEDAHYASEHYTTENATDMHNFTQDVQIPRKLLLINL